MLRRRRVLLAVAAGLLLAIGLVMVFSASAIEAALADGTVAPDGDPDSILYLNETIRLGLLLQRAAEVGVPFAGGMLMLVLQAAEAQRLWYGAEFSDGDLKSLISAANEEMTRRFTPA